ncbi:2-oxo acid dehydrogenase subunit E2 [Rhodoblastus acidophilus]|uniref:Dihydrolipoamide acetyltransferase component of pyruvate dehydrogenase complex n=1 Tax=Candidatus Rhodoblastus alkanivorans TaxID=2954117 RepID=A0ABS9Z6G5_9HYPH|nr:2-oxo acid dehydrogenase subunit E2 [Candidatus Rhodoblastus alkanivorans]MCI4679191.1 2-oxo acid dehydrogenase subunit E2 [Candidatus Rhodoblastus alkanivorans]MCI4683187.1 2-oxo acid dehydrogenase subunit E2 [Candidatus Rhodoblastus alkanivorans]MDI4640499.1 2-oxo acid dehydrogenase subunit E2 [Rhodoblastus acidophilus]
MATAILMPSIEPSMKVGRLTRWLRREGDFVEAGDVVAEIACPHGAMDVEAPRTGVLTRIFVPAGAEDVAVDAEIGQIEPGPAPHLSTRILASPRARRLAHEAGFDLSRVSGGGPNGRIIEADVRAALERGAPRQDVLRHAARAAAGGRMRPLIESAEWTPQVHLEVDCRIDALEAFRARLNAARGKFTTRVSLLDCLVKALALALIQAPRANVARAGEGFELAARADVAIALSLGSEIVAPALPGAEAMSLDQIAAARAAFLAGRFSPNAFIGGVSLIANLGAFGVRRILPAVVPPWTSVLGVGAAEQRIVVEQGAPAVATVLAVALAIDRRAMDEPAAGALLAAFKALIERPEGLAEV